MNLDRRLLGWALRANGALALTVVLGLLAGGLIVGQAWLLSQAVSRAFLGGEGLPQIQSLLLAFLGLSLARACLVWGSEVSAGRVAGQVKQDLRQRLAARLLSLGPAYTSGERSGELTNTVVEGVEALDAYLRQYLPQVALSALLPLTILLFVFPLDWVSGLVLLLTAPLIPVFMILIGSAADALTRRQWSSLSRMSAHFLDVLQGLATLKMLGRARDQIQAIAEISESYRRTTMAVLRVAFLSALVLEMVGTISTAVVAVQVGLRLLYGRLAFDQAFFVLILAPEFYLPLRMLGARFHAGMAGVSAAGRIFEVLGEDCAGPRAPAEGQAENRHLLGKVDEKAQPMFPVSFKDVSYAYDEGRRPALNGVTLTVKQGEVVALVGRTGAGKSTVASLLLRFLGPDSGQITAGGEPLAHVPPALWRQRVAWVPQSPYLFYGTVSENITLGRPGARREEVIAAARRALADEFIEALPQGYDTVIGERGARLSGGQAQRIALARAFLKDAPLVILDEATAHLDPEVELQVQAAMERLLEGRTALVIAHRLGTVEAADRVLVLDGGQVVESGSHTVLMEQGGLYRGLVEAYTGSAAAGIPATGGAPAATSGEIVRGMEQPLAMTERIPYDWVHPPLRPGSRAGLGVFRRLMSLAAPVAGWMAMAVLLGWATIASSIGLMATAAYVIARAALQPSIAVLQVAIVGVRFFGISRGVFRYLERIVSHQVTFRLLARLRVWFYRAVEPLAPARLLSYRSGDLLARVVSDVEVLENFYLRVLAPPMVALLVSTSVAVLLGRFSWRLAGALLACLLAAGVGVPLLAGLAGRGPGRRLVRLRSDLTATLVDLVQGLPDVLAFGQEGVQLDRVRKLGREIDAEQRVMDWVTGLHSALTGLLMNVGTWWVLALAIPQVTDGNLDGVYLALLSLAAIASFEPVIPLAQAFQNLQESLEAGRRLFDIVDAEPAVAVPLLPQVVPESHDMRVEGLQFAYPGEDRPTLDGISFVLPAGKTLAVVGPSGAGKSTLMHVLLRFWDYDDGRILAGGCELSALDPDAWRRRIAIVSQRTHLFNGTIRDNLLLARPEATQEEIVQAARQARIHEFVSSLPQGYDTWIGELGQRLSGGERQRLAIARAILKDAPILLLDEPTANLDAITESQVRRTLKDLGAGRTVLVATHRLAGLEDVEEILVLDSGRLTECGTHAELMATDSHYRRMVESQTRWLEPIPEEGGDAEFVL